jgi:hypothetical protein
VQDSAGPPLRLVHGGRPALGRAQISGDVDVGLGTVEVDADHRPAGIAEAAGRGGADPRRGAGDDGGTTVRQRDGP